MLNFNFIFMKISFINNKMSVSIYNNNYIHIILYLIIKINIIQLSNLLIQ